MSKSFSLVILLITLGIISFDHADGNGSEIITDITVILKIRQVCCKNNLCYTIAEGQTCGGKFQILLQTSSINASQTNVLNGSEKNEREILITDVNSDGNAPNAGETKLLRSIEAMFATQCGPTTLLFTPNDSYSIKETNQPQEIQENKVTQNPDPVTENPLSTTISAEEYDEPQKICVKKEDALFEPNYANILLKKTIMGRFPITYYLPMNTPSMNCDKVNSYGFSEKEIETIQLEVLHKANYYRSLYGMRELELDENINNYSQSWANHLAKTANHLRINSTVEHSNREYLDLMSYGENLFTSLPIKYVGEVAVDICYFEVGSIGDIDQENEYEIFKNDKIQRLTQLLWKVTETIGVGAAKGKDGKYYVVMNFNPRGNVEHFMKDNIPIFKQPQIDEAKEKLKSINNNLKTLVERLQKGTVNGAPSLPGWKSMLYEKKIQK